MTMYELKNKRCLPCEGGVKPFTREEINNLLKELPEWACDETATQINKRFTFRNFYHTMAFVNAVAWMAHQENHHPDLEVSYNHCLVRYNTHAIGGLSENDFICEAKVNALLEENK